MVSILVAQELFACKKNKETSSVIEDIQIEMIENLSSRVFKPATIKKTKTPKM